MVTSESEFHQRLNTLVADAIDNGIDVEGAYVCRGPSSPSYEVEITEVTNNQPD